MQHLLDYLDRTNALGAKHAPAFSIGPAKHPWPSELSGVTGMRPTRVVLPEMVLADLQKLWRDSFYRLEHARLHYSPGALHTRLNRVPRLQELTENWRRMAGVGLGRHLVPRQAIKDLQPDDASVATLLLDSLKSLTNKCSSPMRFF